MRPDRHRRERRGRRAERLAALALQLKGYRILGRRVRTPSGEIDLVARRGNVVAFVEVKARENRAIAAESVSARQRRRIVRAAAHFMATQPRLAGTAQRFDMILVSPRAWPQHVISAWSESGD